jgi:hypothetical protein
MALAITIISTISSALMSAPFDSLRMTRIGTSITNHDIGE